MAVTVGSVSHDNIQMKTMYTHVSRGMNVRLSRPSAMGLLRDVLRDLQVKMSVITKAEVDDEREAASDRRGCSAPFRWTPYIR